MTSQAFDAAKPIWSESAVLAAGDDDGEVSVRICRYPSAGVAWIWAHVWVPDVTLGYNLDTHCCDGAVTDVEGPDVVYETTDALCSLRRHGPREAPSRADAVLEAAFHPGAHPPNAPGTIPVRIDATFVPGALSAAPNAGRREVRGESEATIRLPDRTVRVSGHGHWHEQHQTPPRWTTGFTYVSLRGGELSLVATLFRGGVRGFAQRGADLLRVVDAAVGPRGREREVRIELEDGAVIGGTARTVREGSVHIYGKRRPGTRVVVDGGRLVGTINDWNPEG